jgi:hypothetical protein
MAFPDVVPAVAKIVNLNGEKLLIVKVQGDPGVTDYELDITLKPKQTGGGGCATDCGCQGANCSSQICRPLE